MKNFNDTYKKIANETLNESDDLRKIKDYSQKGMILFRNKIENINNLKSEINMIDLDNDEEIKNTIEQIDKLQEECLKAGSLVLKIKNALNKALKYT